MSVQDRSVELREMLEVRTAAVGVVVPVHDEELLVGAALAALGSAFAHPALAGVACRTAIVLDACDDDSRAIVGEWRNSLRSGTRARVAETLEPPIVVECDAASVGLARRVGFAALLASWPELDPGRIWLATTDADSEVPPDWLALQLARHEEGVDIWTGSVTVLDWSHRSVATSEEWCRRYEAEATPTHGTSMGVNAAVYLAAGGFDAVPTGEDQALHRAVLATGGAARHDRTVPVVTSARRHARAPFGFAHALNSLEGLALREDGDRR